MVTAEERMQILNMLAEGKISAGEAAQLLKALEEGSRPKPPPSPQPRWFKVKVTDVATGKEKVNVAIPMGLVNVGIKMGARFAPEVEGVNFDEVISSIKEGPTAALSTLPMKKKGNG